MFVNFNTIGKRLFLAFSILALNVLLISILSYQLNKKNRKIYGLIQRIETERFQIVRLLKYDLDFLRFETINQEFYATGRSSLITKRDSLFNKITIENGSLRSDLADFKFEVEPYMDSIQTTLTAYNQTFNQIKRTITLRGFKDFGVEGKMRQYAHELENHNKDIPVADVLMLRRHEKDFFLRKELSYRDQFNTLADKLKIRISKLNSSDDFIVYLISSYQENFNKLAAIDAEIGMVPTQGLLGSLNSQTTKISKQLEAVVNASDLKADKVIQQSLLSSLIVGVTTMVLSFVLTYITAIRLTTPIKKLSNLMSRYVFNQGLDESELNTTGVTNEIRNLSGSFIMLTRKLKAQFDETKKKSSLLERRNQELQKLNEELDRFIYSSAHDLKSPLASMSGLVNLARKEIASKEFDHYFDKMAKSIDRMEGFIRDITDYAKNKRQQIRTEPIDLKIIVDDIFQGLRFLPEMERIEHEVDVDVVEFFTDRTRLEIILKNLISNSIRYSDLSKEAPRIYVRASMQGDTAIIELTDNGIGIGAEHVPKIFDMFYRAVDHAQGSGIGLFLVRESVKMLRGKIQVNSEINIGTVFTIYLPNLKTINVNQLPESEPILGMIEAE